MLTAHCYVTLIFTSLEIKITHCFAYIHVEPPTSVTSTLPLGHALARITLHVTLPFTAYTHGTIAGAEAEGYSQARQHTPFAAPDQVSIIAQTSTLPTHCPHMKTQETSK